MKDWLPNEFTVALLVAAVLVLLLSGGGGLGGASHFIVLHEGGKDDAAFGELKQELQDMDSTVGKAIIAGGWDVKVYDDNSLNKDLQPLKVLVDLKLFDTISDASRQLIAYNPPATLVSKETLPPDATSESVLALIKARGKK